MAIHGREGVTLPAIHAEGDVALGRQVGIYTSSPVTPAVNFPGYVASLNPWLYWQIANVPADSKCLGLTAYYAMDEGSGTSTADSSGFANNATLHGAGATWSAPGEQGSNCILLNGSTGYLSTPVFQSLPMSLSAWLKYHVLPQAGTILAWTNSTANKDVLWFINTNGTLGFYLKQTGLIATSVATVTADTWTQVGFSWDGATYKMVINGTVVTSGAKTETVDGDSWLIGADNFSAVGDFLGSRIDEVGIWGKVLTNAEWSGLAIAGNSRPSPLPVPTCTDSANPNQTAPTGHAWSGAPQPPPNAGIYGTAIQRVPGLLTDNRSAAKPTGSGAIASVSWLALADAPMTGSGWWMACHFSASTLGATSADPDNLLIIPCELGTQVRLNLYTGGGSDTIQLLGTVTPSGSSHKEWNVTAGRLATGKHQVIVKTTSAASGTTTVTCWLDGVNLGTATVAAATGSAFGFLSQGFQAGGNLHAGDVLTIQDAIVMPLNFNPATDMSDTLAAELHDNWVFAGG